MMLLPEDIEPPPFTDEDLEAYFEWQPEFGDESVENFPSDDGVARVADWSVCDTGSAEWAMRRLAHASAEVEEIKAQEDEFIGQIERWAEGQLRPHRRAVNFFSGQLETYARRKREEEGQKTLKLPSGEVASRLNPARPEVPKEAKDEFILWAQLRDLPLVKATWAPVMAEVRKRVEFATVWVPDHTTDPLELIAWPDADGQIAAWVALPRSVTAEQLHEWRSMPADGLPNFHVETWPICDGQRVPGVVLVPEEVTYTVRPAQP